VLRRHPIGVTEADAQTPLQPEEPHIITYDLYSSGVYEAGESYEAYEQGVKAPSPAVQNAAFNQELYGEYDSAVYMYCVRMDDADDIYYMESQMTYGASSCREDMYIAKLNGGNPVTVSPVIGSMDFVRDNGTWDLGISVYNNDGVSYRPADAQERMVLDYLFIPGEDNGGRWLVVNLARTGIGLQAEPGTAFTYTYSLYDRDFNPILTDMPIDTIMDTATRTYVSYRITQNYTPDYLFYQTAFYDRDNQSYVSVPDYTFTRCWYYDGIVYMIAYPMGRLELYAFSLDRNEAPAYPELMSTEVLAVTGDGIMHIIGVEGFGRRAEAVYIRYNLNTGEVMNKTSFSNINLPYVMNRQLVCGAEDFYVYFLSGMNTLRRLRTQEPGYETILKIGMETEFYFTEATHWNLNFFSDDKGGLYFSAIDTYDKKTVVYKLTMKE
jgi:hypothetical protein